MTTEAGTIEKEISRAVQIKKISNVCWSKGMFCPLIVESGLETVNIGWCQICCGLTLEDLKHHLKTIRIMIKNRTST